MKLVRVEGVLIHHTKDGHCIHVDVEHQIPPFYIDMEQYPDPTMEQMEAEAKKIICPVELDYDSVTVKVSLTEVA